MNIILLVWLCALAITLHNLEEAWLLPPLHPWPPIDAPCSQPLRWVEEKSKIEEVFQIDLCYTVFLTKNTH